MGFWELAWGFLAAGFLAFWAGEGFLTADLTFFAEAAGWGVASARATWELSETSEVFSLASPFFSVCMISVASSNLVPAISSFPYSASHYSLVSAGSSFLASTSNVFSAISNFFAATNFSYFSSRVSFFTSTGSTFFTSASAYFFTSAGSSFLTSAGSSFLTSSGSSFFSVSSF